MKSISLPVNLLVISIISFFVLIFLLSFFGSKVTEIIRGFPKHKPETVFSDIRIQKCYEFLINKHPELNYMKLLDYDCNLINNIFSCRFDFSVNSECKRYLVNCSEDLANLLNIKEEKC